MRWHGGNVLTLHLICVAMPSFHEDADIKIIFHAIKTKKKEQLRLMSIHLTQMSSFCSSEDNHSFPRKLHLPQIVGHNREEYGLKRYMMNLSQQRQLPCQQDFMHHRS